MIQKEAVTEIIVAISGKIRGETFQAILDAQETGVEVVPMPTVYEELLGRVPIQHLESDWLIRSFVDEARVSGFFDLAKRLIDILIAVIGLIICVILTPITALIIVLDTGFPILYKQVRSGKGNSRYIHLQISHNEPERRKRWPGTTLPRRTDSRVTRIGSFLRRTHIDELPQFWNVLRGDMSVVGPRAERPELITKYMKEIPFYRARLLVKPGITGWAQVNFGYSCNSCRNNHQARI